ncbi:MAG: hypothetical protein Q8P81_01120 [Nanoarchaeota archaeon]|nr:hypothetical protein [Nanoarchaeota archaeon]
METDKKRILYVDGMFAYEIVHGSTAGVRQINDVDVYMTPNTSKGIFLAERARFDMLVINSHIDFPGSMIRVFRRSSGSDAPVVIYSPDCGAVGAETFFDEVVSEVEYQNPHLSVHEKLRQSVNSLRNLEEVVV